MQVFLPSEFTENNAMFLDDKRLNKQIVELTQLLVGMYNIDVLNVPTDKIGFSNHPIFKYYNQSMEYRAFLYYCLINDCIKQVKPAYIKGNIVDNSIFYTTKYQELLTSKWFEEIDNGTMPKFTYRGAPNFFTIAYMERKKR